MLSQFVPDGTNLKGATTYTSNYEYSTRGFQTSHTYPLPDNCNKEGTTKKILLTVRSEKN